MDKDGWDTAKTVMKYEEYVHKLYGHIPLPQLHPPGPSKAPATRMVGIPIPRKENALKRRFSMSGIKAKKMGQPPGAWCSETLKHMEGEGSKQKRDAVWGPNGGPSEELSHTWRIGGGGSY